MKKVSVFPNRYMDSVTLMGVAFQLADMDGVNGAECGMGTAQNVALLKEEGYEVAESVSKNDLLLAIDAESEERLDRFIRRVSNCFPATAAISRKRFIAM